jgi:hypothetical protein
MKPSVCAYWVWSLLLLAPAGNDNLPPAALDNLQTISKSPPAGKSYPDGHGGTVFFPLGDLSFADEVVAFRSGNPSAANEKDRDPRFSTGIPDYNEAKDVNYTTLGCGGVLTLHFVDNSLVDIDGPDL